MILIIIVVVCVAKSKKVKVHPIQYIDNSGNMMKDLPEDPPGFCVAPPAGDDAGDDASSSRPPTTRTNRSSQPPTKTKHAENHPSAVPEPEVKKEEKPPQRTSPPQLPLGMSQSAISNASATAVETPAPNDGMTAAKPIQQDLGAATSTSSGLPLLRDSCDAELPAALRKEASHEAADNIHTAEAAQ